MKTVTDGRIRMCELQWFMGVVELKMYDPVSMNQLTFPTGAHSNKNNKDHHTGTIA